MSKLSDTGLVKVFFALWPTTAQRSQLTAWQAPLHALCGGRAMRVQTLHATLVFIGQIDPSRLEALQLTAQEVNAEGFELSFDAARYWGHNHIVYAAPTHAPQQLMQLVDALEQHLVRHKFQLELREYKPHVTLLRNAHWTDAPLPAMPAVCWQHHDFALIQSMPDQYRVLARFPLSLSDG